MILVVLEACHQGIGFVAGVFSPLMHIWNATFKEKAAGGPRVVGGWYASRVACCCNDEAVYNRQVRPHGISSGMSSVQFAFSRIWVFPAHPLQGQGM